MPTNEKSEKIGYCHNFNPLEHSNFCGCLCHCKQEKFAYTRPDHQKVCSHCQPTTDKLAEAEKLIEDWPNEVARRMHNLSQRGYAKALYAADIAEIVTIVLAAQDLISYEKGREEQRKETENELKDLRHFKDSSVGLWCTDKEPQDKTNFFQLS